LLDPRREAKQSPTDARQRDHVFPTQTLPEQGRLEALTGMLRCQYVLLELELSDAG
jgi:hypothetical protein